MAIVKALTLLERLLDEIPRLKRLPYKNLEFTSWDQRVKEILRETFGNKSNEYARYNGIILLKLVHKEDMQQAYIDCLNQREMALKSIIQKHEILGIKQKPTDTVTLQPKAFIAHEGETRALTILKEFLEALGVQYLIAEAQPSNGRSVERQVDWTMGKADFAICLATKGKTINKKTRKHYMGLNIAEELGRARQIYGNHIILLVQKGVEVHTNTREIVYETFTTTNMERALIKIARELTNWGFIKAGTIKEQT